MADVLIKALDGNIQIYLLRAKKVVKKATVLHDFWPSATKAFGRLTLISLVMGSDLKEGQKITTIVNGDGRLGTLMCEVNNKGQIRGYVANPHVNTVSHVDRSMVALAIGDEGYLQVIKNYGLKNTYTSKIKLIKGELVDEFNQYFWKSEQIPNGMLMSVVLSNKNYVGDAGIIFVKFLPNYEAKDLKKVEEIFKILKPFDERLKKMSLHNLLFFAFPNAKIIEEKKVSFKCECNKNKIDLIIKLLNEDDVIKNGEKYLKIKCEFCSKVYKVKKDEALKIIKKKG